MKISMIVEDHEITCDEITQESTALLLTLPDWFQAWIGTTTRSMQTKSQKLKTAIRENEGPVKRMREFTQEEGDHHEHLWVRLSNLKVG